MVVVCTALDVNGKLSLVLLQRQEQLKKGREYLVLACFGVVVQKFVVGLDIFLDGFSECLWEGLRQQ